MQFSNHQGLPVLAGASLGDVALRRNPSRDASLPIAQRGDQPLHDVSGAVLAVVDRLALKRRPGEEGGPHPIEHGPVRQGTLKEARGAAQHLMRRIASHGREGRVDVLDAWPGFF